MRWLAIPAITLAALVATVLPAVEAALAAIRQAGVQ